MINKCIINKSCLIAIICIFTLQTLTMDNANSTKKKPYNTVYPVFNKNTRLTSSSSSNDNITSSSSDETASLSDSKIIDMICEIQKKMDSNSKKIDKLFETFEHFSKRFDARTNNLVISVHKLSKSRKKLKTLHKKQNGKRVNFKKPLEKTSN